MFVNIKSPKGPGPPLGHDSPGNWGSRQHCQALGHPNWYQIDYYALIVAVTEEALVISARFNLHHKIIITHRRLVNTTMDS